MAPDDHSGAKPAGPVVLRIKLRYDDLDAMVQKFAPNVGKSGLFLPTKSIQPVGTEVKFELRLTNDVPVLVGLGRVKHVRPPDPKHPKAAFGMAIELLRVSREGREVIIRMIERRRAMGLADIAIPMPEDAEAARRSEVDSHPRADTSAVVRDAMAQLASASAPAAAPLLAAQPASGPIAVAKEPSGGIVAKEPSGGIVAKEPSGGIVAKEPSGGIVAKEPSGGIVAKEPSGPNGGSTVSTEPPRRPSAPLLTSPRASSGAIPVAPLAPEKSRPRRPRVQELIDKAAELSAPIIAALPTPELDMHVDIEDVLTRARALAGGELDVELATLREAAAAPVEISVEAASAELARQLGGKPIAKRERSGSARWAPPPAVAELRAKLPAEDPPFATKTRAETEAAPSATIAAAVEAAIESGVVDAVEPATAVEEHAGEARERASAVEAREHVPAVEAREHVPAVEAREHAPAVEAREPAPAVEAREPAPAVEARAADTHERMPAVEAVEPVPAVEAREPVAAVEERESAPSASDDEPTPILSRDAYDDAFVPNVTTTTAVDDPLDAQTEKPRRFASASELKTDPTTSALLIDDDADVLSFERALDAARTHTGVSKVTPVPVDVREPDDDDDDAVGDYAQAERTQIGGIGAYAHTPSIPDELAAQLDQQLAEAEAEAERDFADGMGSEQGYAPEGLAGEQGYAPEGLAGEQGYAPEGLDDDDDDAEEISDLDVLAEADEDDADLLAAGDAHHDTLAPPSEQPYGYDPLAPQSDDFASRLDLGDDDEPPPSDEFDRDAAREFDREAAREFDEDLEPNRHGHGHGAGRYDHAAPSAPAEPRRPVLPALAAEPARPPRYRRPSSEFPDPPSSSYTFAENFPQAGLQLGPDDGGEDFDEPHAYAPAPAPVAQPARPVGPDPRLLRYGRATTASTEDLEDALAALDVDLDEIANLDQRRPRRPTPSSSTGPRPLPGLPMERSRDATGPAPIVSTARNHPPSGSHPVSPARNHPPSGSHPVAQARNHPPSGSHPVSPARNHPPSGSHPVSPARNHPPSGSHPVAPAARAPRSPTGQVSVAKPPPIPAAARKSPTQQVAVVQTPSKRASTDEGVIIDFDDDD